MWQTMQPFKKHVCVVFLSIALITSILSIKERKSFLSYNLRNEPHSGRFILNKGESEMVGNYSGVVMDEINYFGPNKNGSNVLHILGLFELSTKAGERVQGKSEMLAAQLAVRHVNLHNVIPGYKLNMLINDTKCDPGVGIDRFFHALYSNMTIIMLLGTSCSNVTESLAHVVPYWNVLQVSFGSKSPSLSDRNKFPLFFRTAAPDSSHNSAKIHFVKEFGWKVVATFYQSENAYLLPLNHLVTELERVNISCISTVTFSSDNYKEQLKILKDLDIRIIFASFSSILASKIFCAVYHMGMYGEDYVWILQDLDDIWWYSSLDCPKYNLIKALEGLIIISDSTAVPDDQISISGLEHKTFHKFLNMSSKDVSRYAKQTYDAVWAIALTLRETMINYWFDPLENFGYSRRDMVLEFLEKMSGLTFIGLSGPVKFHGGDRIGNSIIQQIQQGGKVADVAIYDSTKDSLRFNCKSCKKIYWKNGKIPIAQRTLKTKLITIPKLLFHTTLTFSACGILISIMLLVFNFYFRKIKTMKLTSPKLNNLAVFGCIFVYSSVILSCMHYSTTKKSNQYFSQLCTVRVYLLSSGFSLAFGSMFAKTYRVHRIFTYLGTTLVRNKLLKDKQLIVLIFIPLLVDAIILMLWVMIDPMERHLHNLTLEISSSNRGEVYQPQVEICSSHNTVGWYFALYGYKGLILIMGLYMAWKTRHVKVPGLNDSQYIGICVYSAVFSAIIVFLSSLTSEFVIFNYIARNSSILISTTITLFLLFLPKLKSVFGNKIRSDNDPVMQSMGLKIEFNTRRFIIDDPRELINRLEIQNKVYRNEIEVLDREIARLEDQLICYDSTPSTKSVNNLIDIKAECHYLNVPSPIFTRASWPNASGTFGLPRNDFLSENKLNNDFFLDKFNIFGKLKRYFGSIPVVSVHSELSKGQIFQCDMTIKTVCKKPVSNPDFYPAILHIGNQEKAKSEINIIHNRAQLRY